jgi:tRNA threonylcarbamoyladenosine modification (KEOPS) complex  Pcc1 subunit
VGVEGKKKAGPFVVTFTLSMGTTAQAGAWAKRLKRALQPEAEGALPGASVTMRTAEGGRALAVRVEADSLRALRAATNSYLRWTTLAAEVVEAASGAHEED